MIIKLPIALLFALLLGTNARCEESKPFTGMDLLKWIKASEKPIRDRDALNELQCGELFGRMHMAFDYCNHVYFSLPPNVSPSQGIEILKKYLADHPENLNKDPDELIIRSLQKTYPLSDEDGIKTISENKEKISIPMN